MSGGMEDGTGASSGTTISRIGRNLLGWCLGRGDFSTELPVSCLRGWRLGASLLAVVAIAGLCFGCGEGGPNPVTEAEVAPRPVVDTALGASKRFALLRGAPEQIPKVLLQEIPLLEGDPQSAQHLPLLSRDVWIIVASSRVCMAEMSQGALASFACMRLSRVVREGMFIASVPSNAPMSSDFRSVVGIVPDEVVKVGIYAHGARPQIAPVVENVFSLRDKSRAFPESIELIGRGSD